MRDLHAHSGLRVDGFQTMPEGMVNKSLCELRDALRHRLDVVADREFFARDAAAHLASLQEASSAVDRVARTLPADTDPVLRHYLERQSYVKALDWLDAQVVQR